MNNVKTKNTKSPNGVILYKGPSKIDGKPIVCIATGLKNKSQNPKTGSLVQTYILREDIHPFEALTTGEDESICGSCKHRKVNGNSCYVSQNGPGSVWRAYKRGIYPKFNAKIHLDLFKDKMIRLGSYGEVAAANLTNINKVLSITKAHTNYTHLWKQPKFQNLKSFSMASCDSIEEAIEAKSKGWRPFLVVQKGENPGKGYFNCPASEEAGKKLTCLECKACNGGELKNERIPTPYIEIHGVKANNLKKWQATTLTIKGK